MVARYPAGRERSAIMPLLYLAQSIEGHVSRDGLRAVAGVLGLTTAEVEAVATFYTMFRLRPTGTHVVNVCTNLACALRGARAVHAAAREAAGLREGQELSDDGLFTVDEEECLGVCDVAVAAQVNVANHDRVTPDGIRELVEALRAGEVPTPARGPAVRSFKEASRALAGLEPEGAPA
ncbi:MAG TPA: NAD(P)H-dependent oxidoreductase subunit E [Actinomycetota bacterium]|nr:NAD(P)H-dependent oxidoreductase subunit E [Actinomycetota bacterium]